MSFQLFPGELRVVDAQTDVRMMEGKRNGAGINHLGNNYVQFNIRQEIYQSNDILG